MVNHRLLKAIIRGESAQRPTEEVTLKMGERRRLNRMAERDVSDWLYARFLQKRRAAIPVSAPRSLTFPAAACACACWITVPSPLFRPRSFTPCAMSWYAAGKRYGTGKGEVVYRVTDVIEVTIAEVRMETRSIVARPAA